MLVEKSNFTVTRMVRFLGVSRSGFYAWLGRVPSKRDIRAERIEAKVAWFHGDSDEVSGSPRILSLIHISQPTRLLSTSYAVFCLKKKKNKNQIQKTKNKHNHKTKKTNKTKKKE